MTIRDMNNGMVEVSVSVVLTPEEVDALWVASESNLGELNRALQRSLFKGMESEFGFEKMEAAIYAEREASK